MNKTFSVVTLGCKTNQFESAAMVEQLEKSGYRQIDFAQGAGLVVVNTCTVTAATDTQSRNLIRRARRMNPAARIVVTGCYAQIDPKSLSRLTGVSLVIGNREKVKLIDYLNVVENPGAVKVSNIRHNNGFETLSLSVFAQHSRAFVQIQNGCDAFCSYCIIPYARGQSRSVLPDKVIEQIAKLSANGYHEIVLTGIHIGQYGRDLNRRTNLLELLKAIRNAGFSRRLRLGSIEPTELDSELYHYIAESDWICPHFHIPLQSGDDGILEKMNRHYSTAFFSELINEIIVLRPDAAIGLDVITGFPGETDVHFENTCQFLEQLTFSHLHVFPFSKRPGTTAALMPDQLPGDIIKQRAAYLRQLGEQKYEKFRRQFIGSQQMIVIEAADAAGRCKGLSGHYLPVYLDQQTAQRREMIPVLITGISHDGLAGQRI